MNQLEEFTDSEIAVSDWLTITQGQIAQFATCTKDEQWIHLDEQRARTESVFGSTIAHGYLTLSLLSYFVHQCLELSDADLALNYGLNRVRFPHPVKTGSRIRAHILLQKYERIEQGIQYALSVTIEIEGIQKPACVAEPIFRALRLPAQAKDESPRD